MIDFGGRISFPHGRLYRRTRAALLLTTALSSSLPIVTAQAQKLPTGGSVAAGSVSMTAPTSTQLNITQSSQSAVVNWQSFSIGQGSAVNIQQPNSTSAMLNRVTGNTPSTIAGSLTANGQVYLVNPNGIAITGTGVVNTGGGFVASTLGISDADFLSGKRTFNGNGASAAVSNAGIIRVGRGGYAALLGGTVSNSGKIIVPLGQIGLGSGESATLDFSGDGFLQVALPTRAGSNAALISNSGTIKAAGGSIIISAATAREAARNAVNISGIVQARSIGGESGSIFIGGGAGGDVNVSGRLSATGRQAAGGAVTVTGKDITLAGAIVDVSGKRGGGTINIGGGRQGQGPLQQADTVSIDNHTAIHADATASGNGGNVVVWSDQLTTFAGTISAHGGAQRGHGGEAEVSGKARLVYTGFTDLSAANGQFGTLLLDPYNVIISSGANNTGGSYTANTNDSVINVDTLQNALGAANVTITTTGNSGTQAGNITVAAPLTWSVATTLALNAAGAIAINAPIAISGGGGLALTATGQAGVTTTGLTFGNGASIDYGATDHGGTFSLNGTSYTLVYSMAQLDAIDGVNAVNSSALTTYGAGLTGNYALATNLNATGTTYTQALIGTNSSAPAKFSGQFDGLGHTVAGLTINAPGSYAGLLGFATGAASISNIGLVGGSVTGQSNIGSLVGWLDSGAVVQTSFSGAAVTGTGVNNAGGLIGFNAGTVQSSYASGPVTATYGTGGLVGWNTHTIVNSYATGGVTGVQYTGGLIGINSGSVNGSHATGAVTGTGTGATAIDTGGLIGYHQSGSVNASYASGAVTGPQNVGGLIGVSAALVQASYATGAVRGTGDRTGGLIAQNLGTLQNSYATGAVSGTTRSGGLVGLNSPAGTVSSSYSTGTVAGVAASTGGLIGLNNGAATAVTSSYWDTPTSGLATSAGGVGVAGLTTAQLQGVLPTGFSNTVWSTGAGLYPYLNWQFAAGTTPQSLSGIAHQANGTALAGAVLAGTINGAAFAGATGANGYYYLLLPQGTTAQGSGIFIDIAGNAVKANDYVHGAFGSLQNLDLNAGALNVRTDATALSSLASVLAGVVGSTPPTDLVFSTPAGVLTPKAGTSVSIAASGAFSVDQNLVVPNALQLTAAGSLAIAPTGSLSSSGGNATLVGSSFVNGAGAAAVAAPNGRWLIYSGDPANDSRGGLAYDFKQYGATYGMTAVAQAAGNGVLYTVMPTIGLTGAASKIYDGNTSVAPGSFSVGFAGYDQDLVTLTYSNLVYGDANAGTGKTVTASGVAVTAATNGGATVYGYASTTTASGNIGTIAARAITVTADAQSRIYGDANPVLSYTVGSGLVSGDNLSGSLAATATTTTSVGSYGITLGSLANSNYALTYAAANLSITARPLTVTADAQSRVYGNANPALSYTIGGSGLVNGDSLSGSLATSATVATGVGSYGITQGSVAASSNYALTYAAANLSVTTRPLTVTADAQSRVYGNANPTLTYAVGGSGLVNGDSLNGTLATTATVTTGIGSYGIAEGNLANSNYALTYAAANLTVTARPITVTADAQSRIYGDANPVLTYTVGALGLVNGDTLAGSLSTVATPASVAGSYAITQGTLVNALNPNYAIGYVGTTLVVSVEASSSPAAAATPSAPPFIVATPDVSTPKQASINFQSDQSATAVIAPLAVMPARVASTSDPATQTAARQDPDDDIVTGSITPPAFKSADGFVYKPLSQYDAAQYSGKTLPGFASQAGEAAVFTMLLRGALGLPDTPEIDNLFEPGKGLQWRGANWENPLADKVRVSDGADHSGAPGESFPIKPGTTDLAALLGKGPLILTGPSNAANAAPFSLLGVTMSEEGIVANDPGTGLQVLLNYHAATRTLGSIASVFDPKTKTWTRLADVKPTDDRQSQAQLDRLATWSGDRFASVSVPHQVP